MINAVPVLPPKYRPISQMSGKGGVSVEDSNFLYTELIKSAENVSQVKEYMDDTGDENLAMYDAHKALVGLTDPASHELKQRKVKGLLKTILGKSTPKNSMMQRKLLSGTADTIGRGVIMVDSSLDMDEAGIPENMAFEMFQPYIIRNLVQSGVSRVDALKQVTERTDKAREMLAKEMDRRPITITRAPVLHRGGVQGFKPVLIKGDAIRLPPMSYEPFAGDNDGDAVNVNVPHSPKAVSEVNNRMLPSKSLISEKDFKQPNYAPSQDHVLGLYQASKGPDKKKRVRVFATWADAEAAEARGELDVDQEVKIMS
jgi:DNA-directed RNA polymerase subunit beta'